LRSIIDGQSRTRKRPTGLLSPPALSPPFNLSDHTVISNKNHRHIITNHSYNSWDQHVSDQAADQRDPSCLPGQWVECTDIRWYDTEDEMTNIGRHVTRSLNSDLMLTKAKMASDACVKGALDATIHFRMQQQQKKQEQGEEKGRRENRQEDGQDDEQNARATQLKDNQEEVIRCNHPYHWWRKEQYQKQQQRHHDYHPGRFQECNDNKEVKKMRPSGTFGLDGQNKVLFKSPPYTSCSLPPMTNHEVGNDAKKIGSSNDAVDNSNNGVSFDNIINLRRTGSRSCFGISEFLINGNNDAGDIPQTIDSSNNWNGNNNRNFNNNRNQNGNGSSNNSNHNHNHNDNNFNYSPNFIRRRFASSLGFVADQPTRHDPIIREHGSSFILQESGSKVFALKEQSNVESLKQFGESLKIANQKPCQSHVVALFSNEDGNPRECCDDNSLITRRHLSNKDEVNSPTKEDMSNDEEMTVLSLPSRSLLPSIDRQVSNLRKNDFGFLRKPDTSASDTNTNVNNASQNKATANSTDNSNINKSRRLIPTQLSSGDGHFSSSLLPLASHSFTSSSVCPFFGALSVATTSPSSSAVLHPPNCTANNDVGCVTNSNRRVVYIPPLIGHRISKNNDSNSSGGNRGGGKTAVAGQLPNVNCQLPNANCQLSSATTTAATTTPSSDSTIHPLPSPLPSHDNTLPFPLPASSTSSSSPPSFLDPISRSNVTADNLCGICLVQPPDVSIQDCHHVICRGCARILITTTSILSDKALGHPPTCPFCRRNVRRFMAAGERRKRRKE